MTREVVFCSMNFLYHVDMTVGILYDVKQCIEFCESGSCILLF